MVVTGKQRAYLRGLANSLEPVFQIGKGGVTDVLVEQLRLVLDTRELIKVHILETALLDTKETCNEIAARLDAVPVQAIGSKFVLYKQSSQEKYRKIEIPGMESVKKSAKKTVAKPAVKPSKKPFGEKAKKPKRR